MKFKLTNMSNYLSLFIIFSGFGFITFADPSSVDKVLSHEQHELDGKRVIFTVF